MEAREDPVLEKSDFYGRWIPVDSTKVGDNGEFSIRSDAPASPEIYRLALCDRFIYFPVDSVESLKVTSDAADFGVRFSLEGTPQAARVWRNSRSRCRSSICRSPTVSHLSSAGPIWTISVTARDPL